MYIRNLDKVYVCSLDEKTSIYFNLKIIQVLVISVTQCYVFMLHCCCCYHFFIKQIQTKKSNSDNQIQFLFYYCHLKLSSKKREYSNDSLYSTVFTHGRKMEKE
jgi:hypothetical protein